MFNGNPLHGVESGLESSEFNALINWNPLHGVERAAEFGVRRIIAPLGIHYMELKVHLPPPQTI